MRRLLLQVRTWRTPARRLPGIYGVKIRKASLPVTHHRRFFFADSSLASSSSLSERTQQLLSSSTSVSDHQVVNLLQEWLVGKDNDSSATVNAMQEILTHWTRQGRPQTIEPFLLVLEKQRQEGQGHAAAQTLDQWGHLLEGDLQLSPTLQAFHLVLDAYSKDSNDDVIQSSLDLLEFLERTHSTGNLLLEPKVETYAHVINTLFWNRRQDDVHRLNNIHTMKRLVSKLNYDATLDDQSCAYHMIRGYSKAIGWAVDNYAQPSALKWFRKLQRELRQPGVVEAAASNKDDDDSMVPATIAPESLSALIGKAYKSAFRIIWQQNSTDCKLEIAHQGQEMITELEKLQMDPLPWPQHYQSAIELWAEAHDQQESVDQIMYDLLKSTEDLHLHRNKKLPLKLYERVVWVWCRSNEAKRAEALLRHVMGLLAQQKLVGVSPQLVTRMWNYVMMAYYHEEQPERVVDLWKRLLASRKETSLLQPDEVTYSAILKSLAAKSHDALAIHDATRILREMEKAKIPVKAHHVGSVIAAWSRSPGKQAATQANTLLEQLEQSYHDSGGQDESLKPNMGHYSAVITAFARSRQRNSVDKAVEVFERMKQHYPVPDVVAYSAVIDALGRSKSPQAAERAEELLKEMEGFAPSNLHARPNKVCYTTVMSSWAKSGAQDAPERAQAILKRLEAAYEQSNRKDDDLRPDIVAYGTLIDAWAKSSRADAGERAEEILRQWKEEGLGEINSVLYTNVIMAYLRSKSKDAAERAVAILDDMEDDYASGNLHAMPDTRAHTAVIQCIARSHAPDKATHAWKRLLEMCEAYRQGNLNLQPNEFTLTAVLSACAYTRGPDVTDVDREEAVRIALRVMTEFNDLVRPSHVTFRTLLQVFGNQVKDLDERVKYGSVAFERCCQEGQVDASVIETLRKYMPSLCKKLPRDEKNEINLPPEWSFNVKANNNR